jgi:hypothetical protein
MFAVFLSLIATVPTFADVRIVSSSGGEVRQYLRLFSLLRQSSERAGHRRALLLCLHARVEHNSTPPNLRHTEAVLGFHAPAD